MTPAAVVLLYSVAVAWRVPSVLTRLTLAGVWPRLGLAVWLTAMASVLFSGSVALYFLIRAAVDGWTHLAFVVCQSVSRGTCTTVVYTSVLAALGLGIAAALGTLAAAVLSWRYARRMRQSRQQTRAHAQTARLAGRPLPAHAAAVVLDAPQLAAYCVPPGVIVVTTAALDVLAPAQLDAVLAHERAHLAGRHHLVTAIARSLAATFPAAPLFSRGKDEIARLAEMAADDIAALRAGRRPLIEALIAFGTGTAVHATALGVASYAVAARVDRLLTPAERGRQAGYLIGSGAALVLLPLLSALVIAYAGAAL